MNTFSTVHDFITDFQPLSFLVNLEELHLSGQFEKGTYWIDGTSPVLLFLKELTNLKVLDLSSNHTYLQNFDGIQYLSNLEWLNLSETIIPASETTHLSQIVSLRYLYLNRSSNLVDTYQSFIPSLVNLRVLDLSHHYTRSISLDALTNLTQLEELYLYNTNITDLASISHLGELRILDLRMASGTYWTANQSISHLRYLSKLRELYIHVNSISRGIPIDIEWIAQLTALEQLELSSAEVNDISFISSLGNLRILNLNDNQISDISVLANLNNLEIIDLYNNPISDISVLANLFNLEVIDL